MIEQLILSVTLVLSNGPVGCGTDTLAYGCFDSSTNKIEIDTTLDGETFKKVLLHEAAHKIYNDHPDIDLFQNAPALRDINNLNKWERMADWFYVFWTNLESWRYSRHPWYYFFASQITL